MKRDSDNTPSNCTLIPDPEKPQDERRRKLLKATAAGLVAGVASPIVSSAFAAENTKRKILIAYYSRTGNTRELANQIQQRVGGEMFELRTVHSYPKEYRATTDQAKRELEANFRPQLTAEVQNMGAYDTVFVGYPNWWGTFPMAFFSFFEKYDFAGKTLIPFCTHEGSHLGRSVTDMKSLCPKARILDGIALRGGNNSTVRSDSSRREVDEWLRKLGMTV
ncbi:flavodoxin [Propionivibrio limicola]|uniref:flavodoxin n=1 Tax=Propionivibrio limicola TaxID=167645 RepID=UPI0012916A9F|nr:flavodoxin [Propionivibrio limicola]